MYIDVPPAVLFGRTYRLTGGGQVRFRLAGPGDHPGVSRLLAAAGAGVDELALRRILCADPRRRAVVCATALIAGRETVLGFAAAPFAGDHEVGDHSLLAVDAVGGEELRALLVQALTSRLGRAGRAA